MNNERRKIIEEISNQLEELKEQVAQIGSDMQDEYDSMLESIQESERGDQMIEEIEMIFDGSVSLQEAIFDISRAVQ